MKKCIICGAIYENRDKRSKICSLKCYRELSRNLYKIKKEKPCKDCGDLFYGRDKQIYCDVCKEKRKKNKKYKKIIINHFCVDCGCFVFKEEKNITKKQSSERFDVYCQYCHDKQKEKTRIKRSARMTGENNPQWKPDKERIQLSEEEKIIKRQRIIEEARLRMSTNNPMFFDEVKEKVRNTIKQKYEIGEIKKKFGKNNPLWKGNRIYGQIIRTRLIEWIKQVMERDDFTCQECGKRGVVLEVHHVVPLRILNKKFIKMFGYDSFQEIDKNGVDFSNICDKIVEYHDNHLEIGITYCKECHAKNDKFRKIKVNNNENQKNYIKEI